MFDTRALVTSLQNPGLGLLSIRLSLLCLLLLAPLGEAQNGQQREARMPVRVVAGHLVVRCDLSTRFHRIPVNLFVDLGRPAGLELHNRAARFLKVDQGGLPITIHLSGFNISVPQREHGDENLLNDFTRLHSRELGETPCVGTIGSHILSHYFVILDLHAGFIYLRPPRKESQKPPEERPGSRVAAINLQDELVWFPVRLQDKRILFMNLDTSSYDTVVDADLCEELNALDGNIGPVKLKNVDLARYVAFRPEEVILVHPEGTLGTTGLNLLEHFRVEVDRVNHFIRFQETAPAHFPTEERAFFAARAQEEPQPLIAWLQKHHQTRLGREAGTLLLNLLLEQGGSQKAFQEALQWVDKTRVQDLRATEALKTMKLLLEARKPQLAIAAGELGLKSGVKDRYPESVHKLHARIGEILLDQGQDMKAWEHLLSAAFGLPEDGPINLLLGRFYEKQKRYQRALSRDIQAVITPEAGAQAVTALERVQSKMGGPPLSVDLVDRMIAGKVHNFGAATHWKPTPKNHTNRVVLAEFFTNAHLGRKMGESWVSFEEGGAMAAEGLLSFFPRDKLILLTYHLDVPEPTALMNLCSAHAIQRYGIQRPVWFLFDGMARGPGAARWRKAEQLFNRNRQIALEELQIPSDYLVKASVQVKQGVVSGEVLVQGPDRPDVNVEIVLAERGVLYPGKGKVVVHRMVARSCLTPDLDGVAFHPQSQFMSIPFKKSLKSIEDENRRFLEEYEAKGGANTSRLSLRIDPRQVSVVAILRDTSTLGVLQAAQADAAKEEEE